MSLIPQDTAPELTRIEQLLDAGQFQEALQAVEVFEQHESHNHLSGSLAKYSKVGY